MPDNNENPIAELADGLPQSTELLQASIASFKDFRHVVAAMLDDEVVHLMSYCPQIAVALADQVRLLNAEAKAIEFLRRDIAARYIDVAGLNRAKTERHRTDYKRIKTPQNGEEP